MIHLRAGAIVLCSYVSWSTAFVALPVARSPWRSSSMLPQTAMPLNDGGGGSEGAFDGANEEARRHQSEGAPDEASQGASPLSGPDDSPSGGTDAEASSKAPDEDEDSAAAAGTGTTPEASSPSTPTYAVEKSTSAEIVSSVDNTNNEGEQQQPDEDEFVTLRYRAQADVGGPSASEAVLAPLVGRAKRRAAEQAAREAKAKAMVLQGGAPSGKWEGAQSRQEEDVLDAAVRAHAEFYKALNQRDLGGMRRVWLEGSDCEVQCTHPLFEEFASPESTRDGGVSGKGEYAGRGLFVGGYKPITEAFGKAFKYSNANKDDRIKRSKTVPINLRARLLGPHSVLILCTDNITGPAAVGDNSRAPIKVTGTTTALLRKDMVRNEWRVAHLHAALCTASGSFNDAQKGSSSSGSSGPRVIRISSDGSGAISSSSGGSSSSSQAAEDLGMQIGELIAKEMAGNNKGGSDSTESIIEQVLGGLMDDDDDDDDEDDDISGPRIVVVRRGSSSGNNDDDDDDDDDEDDEPRSRLRSALGDAIAAASGSTSSSSSSSSSGGQVLPGGRGFGDKSSSSSRRDRSNGSGSNSNQLDRIAASLDQLVALQQAKAAVEGASAASTATTNNYNNNGNSNDALRQQVQTAARALEVASRRQRAVAAVRVLARQGALSPAQKQALLKDVVAHAHESKMAQTEWHRAVSAGNSAGNGASNSAGRSATFETVSLVEAALEMLLPDDDDDETKEAVDFQALLASSGNQAESSTYDASAAVATAATDATDSQREDLSLAAQLENVRRDALTNHHHNDENGAFSTDNELVEFAEQARAVADMLLEEWSTFQRRK